MENLSLTDTPPTGPAMGLGVPSPPQPQPQLPPQMFTTAAQLLDLTDSEDLPFHVIPPDMSSYCPNL
jgi:U6 snRNA-associated Sm-like protein LSm1